jgi:hypothetical protein
VRGGAVALDDCEMLAVGPGRALTTLDETAVIADLEALA